MPHPQFHSQPAAPLLPVFTRLLSVSTATIQLHAKNKISKKKA